MKHEANSPPAKALRPRTGLSGALRVDQPDEDPSQFGQSEAEQCLHVLFEYAPDAIVLLDVESGRFLDANPAAEKLFGLPRGALLELEPFELSPRLQPGGLSSDIGGRKIAEAASGGVAVFEWWHRNARGERFPCEVHLVRMPWKSRIVIRGSIVESTPRLILELSAAGHRKILDRIASGASLAETLNCLVRAIEGLLPGMLCSILLLDRTTNCLHHAAAPSLPDFYNAAVNGVAIGPTVGSCGAAAFLGRRIVVNDVSNHPNWAAFRELTERANLSACWSEPIVSMTGEVLGTFAMYYNEPAEPAPAELMAIQLAAQMAASAIERVQSQQSLQEMNTTLERRVAEETRALLESYKKLEVAELNARLSAVAFETNDSIVITNQNGQILHVNRSFIQLTGYTAEEVVGKTPRVLRSGRHDGDFYGEMWRAIRTEGFWNGEIWHKRKDGHEYLQRLTVTAVRDASGKVTHYVGDGQDLTLEKQAEANRAELLAARAVQRSLLPSNGPCLPGFDIAGGLYPADNVSGDFFDFFSFPEKSVGILVADVSGHGLGPGLLMAQTQAHLRSIAEQCCDPGEILSRANRFFGRINSGHFVTTFLGRLDVAARSFVYAGAGHQGYLLSANGKVHVLKSTSTPLGVEEHWTLRPSPAVALEAGDIILLPTDGIEEAVDPNKNYFGRDRMFEVIRENAEKSAVRIIESLYSAARDFAGGQRQADDMTAVIVKVLHTQ